MSASSSFFRVFWPFAFGASSQSLVAATPGGEQQRSCLARWQQALQTAGLGNIGRHPRALTLLPPTDAAFEALLTEQGMTWAELTADIPALRQLLLGHVLPAPLQPGLNRTLGDSVIPLRGDSLLDAQQRRARRLVEGIDRVLLPPQRSLLETLHADPDLRAFARLLHDSGLDVLLKGNSPFTLLVPTASGLLRCPPLTPSALAAHVIPGHWLSAELPWGSSLRSTSSIALHFNTLGLVDSDQPLLPGSDLLARHGVIHRISRPLFLTPTERQYP